MKSNHLNSKELCNDDVLLLNGEIDVSSDNAPYGESVKNEDPEKESDAGIHKREIKSAQVLSEENERLKRELGILDKEYSKLKKKLSRVTVQNKKLDEQVFDLFTISQAGKVFIAHHNLDTLAEILLSIIVDRVSARKCSLLLLNEETQTYNLRHCIGLDKSKIKDVCYEKKEGLFWRMISNGEPFSVVDVEGGLRFPQIFEESGLDLLKSTFWIPLKTKDNVIGILTIDNKSVNETDLNFMTLLLAQAAAAFEGAFLYKKLEMASLRAEKQMHNLSILYDVGKALNFIDDLTKLLALILDRAIDIVESQIGSLMLFDEDTNELVVRVVRGIDRDTEEKILSGEIQSARLRSGEGVAGTVFSTGEPMIINSPKDDVVFKDSIDKGIDNILCVPLKVYDECIGVIIITNKKNRELYTNDDLNIVTALANQVAVAINNAKLYEMAVTDSLTRILIRRHFMQRLVDEIRRSKRYGHRLSLVMLDLDYFKQINDTYGHQAGDKVLSEVSKIFKKQVRSTDLIGRYGGDEFCFALPETPTDGARVFCERVRSTVETSPLYFESFYIKKTISMGIATFPDHTDDIQELFKLADLALLKSKKKGRNCVSSYDEIAPDERDILENAPRER